MNTSVHSSRSTLKSMKMPACEATTEWLKIDCQDLAATAEVARFCGANGTMEFHITVRLTGNGGTQEQLSTLAKAYQRALDTVKLDPSSTIFRRLFCSDVVNQSGVLDSGNFDALFGATGPCADSVIGQAPLPASKFALWSYHLHDPNTVIEKHAYDSTLSCQRGSLGHHWTSGLSAAGNDNSHEQSRRVLNDYERWLKSNDMCTADHVVRTWWFVQNIDADYQGLVDARCDFFDTHGLTSDTHYIASTGIAGAHPDPAAKVCLDSYAISGLLPEQVRYLTALEFLGPTHDYGVTFERGTAVTYRDRKHLFISGTASINPLGEIVHVGDIVGQFDRTLKNVEALLADADANLGDLASILVYLRDPADGAVVDEMLRDRLGGIPYVLVDAAVCRPGWLIEIEGIAVVSASSPDLPEF